VESPSDEKTFRKLCEKILDSQDINNPVIRPIAPPGRPGILNPTALSTLIRRLYAEYPDIDKILICLDRDCDPPTNLRSLERQLARLGHPNPIYFLVVNKIEGWLIADQRAVTGLIGTTVELPQYPDSECAPDEILENLFRQVNKRYEKTRWNPRIAERLRIEEVMRVSPSFKEFVEAVIAS